MIQAAESASVAARLAAEAIQKKGSSEDRSWFRVLPKPSNFEPKSWEDELAMSRDFSWGLEQYLASWMLALRTTSRRSESIQSGLSIPRFRPMGRGREDPFSTPCWHCLLDSAHSS